MRLCEALVETVDQKIWEIPLLTAQEQAQLRAWNATETEYPPHNCLHELLEEQAERTPEAIAVSFEGRQLSYQALNQRANQLAHHLLELGLKQDQLVGLAMERSLELVVGLLAVLKAGAAYVPLDPEYPRARLAFMMQDADVAVLLTQQSLLSQLPERRLQTITLDTEWNEISQASIANPRAAIGADNLAYVIYTSGSTGVPKGAMNSHRAICNRLLWMQDAFELAAHDRVLQKTPFSFDVSVWEFFWPLLVGAQLVVARPGGHRDSAYLARIIAEHEITTLHFVPSLLRVFLEEPAIAACRSLRRVICSGEALDQGLQERFFQRLPGAELHNLYGPTEAAVDVTAWKCEPHSELRTVPIGRPISNLNIQLLDERMQAVPVGITGELFIGGVGLARGYWNRPALTAERFRPHPDRNDPGARLYRSGDAARYLVAGNIEYLGRVDQQVKIRGMRIELGEIEALLRRHAAVRECVVVARDDMAGDKRLVAYVVGDADKAAADPGLKLYKLPNQLEVAQINKNETDYIFGEIFGDQIYLKNGFSLREGDCVFDVGANIGLFTLFVHQHCRNARVFAFEPLPPTFEVLRTNVGLYGLDVTLFNCGLANESGWADFTFYPKMSLMSGRYADAREDERTRRAYLESKNDALAEFADELLEGRYEAQTHACEMRTLSEIIREHAIEQIDLLKVDVEKSELDVLQGIEEQDWPRIKQIVIEVEHRLLPAVTELLEQHEFKLKVAQGTSQERTGLYNLYGIHRTRAAEGPVEQKEQQSLPVLKRLGLASSDLRDHLREQLPEYMMPSAFVYLAEMPLTASGKVNRRALPAPKARSELQRAYVAPNTSTEKTIAAIWAEVLGLKQVGIEDNFFALGGHSLSAARVVHMVRPAFKIDLPLRSIFEAPTIAELSLIVEEIIIEEVENLTEVS